MYIKHSSAVGSWVSGDVNGLVSPILSLRVLSNTFTRVTTLVHQQRCSIGPVGISAQTRRDVSKSHHAMIVDKLMLMHLPSPASSILL